MARTTEEIIEQMDAEQAAQSHLADLNSTSQTAIYKLWKYIVAQCSNLLEQLWDRKQEEIEKILAQGATPSIYWLRAKAFEFQYDANTPQVMTLNENLVPSYETVDESKRIITRCAITNSPGAATLLVAKNEPPEKLTVGELAAFQGYFTAAGDGTNQAVGIGWAGQSITCLSFDPDLLFLEATIYYSGAYAATIEDACILAIEKYISELGFNPTFRITTLIDRLQDVPGFIDIHIANMSARDAGTAFGAGGPGEVDIVTAGDIITPTYHADAGYMIGETTPGETFADKLTFTAV